MRERAARGGGGAAGSLLAPDHATLDSFEAFDKKAMRRWKSK